MRKVLLVLLGAAVVLALGIGPLVTTASARHIDADDVRGAAKVVAAAGASADSDAVLEAVDDLLELVVRGRPEGVPGNVPTPSDDADGVGLGVAAAAASGAPGAVQDAVQELVDLVTSRPDDDEEDEEEED